MEPGEGVVLSVVSGEQEAEVACGLLRSAGIDCAYRDTEAIDARVVANRGEILDALFDESSDQVLGISAEPETADHDGGSVEYILNRLFGAGYDFVHGGCDCKSSQKAEVKSKKQIRLRVGRGESRASSVCSRFETRNSTHHFFNLASDF